MFSFVRNQIAVASVYCPVADGVITTITAPSGVPEVELLGVEKEADHRAGLHGHYKGRTIFKKSEKQGAIMPLLDHQQIHDLSSLLTRRMHTKLVAVTNGERVTLQQLQDVVSSSIKAFVSDPSLGTPLGTPLPEDALPEPPSESGDD